MTVRDTGWNNCPMDIVFVQGDESTAQASRRNGICPLPVQATGHFLARLIKFSFELN